VRRAPRRPDPLNPVETRAGARIGGRVREAGRDLKHLIPPVRRMEETMGEFSVCQFFPDGSYEYDVRFVPVEKAVERAVSLIRSVGGRIGTTARVIVTDGGDCIALEWIHGKGIVFPPELAGKEWAMFLDKDGRVGPSDVPAALSTVAWRRASHAAGFGMWYAEISHQLATSLVGRFAPASWSFAARRVPGPGRTMVLELGRIGRFWLTNRAGRYSVEVHA
jgi:hypothetical protein